MQFIFSICIWMYASCFDKIGFNVSSMKTASNSSTNSDRGGRKLYRVYYCDSAFSSSLPESLSHSLDVSCSRPLEIHLLASRVFANFPKNYSVNCCIDVCNILRFRTIFYILTITALFEVPFISYYCRFTVPTV